MVKKEGQKSRGTIPLNSNKKPAKPLKVPKTTSFFSSDLDLLNHVKKEF
jgi:hypothetical protein